MNFKVVEGEQPCIPEDTHFIKLKQQVTVEVQFRVGRRLLLRKFQPSAEKKPHINKLYLLSKTLRNQRN